MSELFDELVRKRGFSQRFLKPKYEDLADPFLLPDMKEAIERIKTAKTRKEKILIYGDYDVDGVTASTLMNDALRLAGFTEVRTLLPDRFKDGYGMSKKIVQEALDYGARLVITVDCGSANGEIIAELAKEGIDTIVSDHHEVPAELPKAVAVVNPKRRDVCMTIENFEEKTETLMSLRDLAGVGVAFMIARGMVQEGLIPDGQEKWMLDLVLIGTICDSMRMSEENRILCFYGVKVLAKTRRLGVKELLRTANVRQISSEAIGFQIGPRLNAAGRMANAEIAFKLLNSTKKTEAANLAKELEEFNLERRNQQTAALEEFSKKGLPSDPVIVTTGDWHEGVLGIIAGRLVDDYRRPAFVLSESEKGILKGSGRSFGDFNLAEALRACENEIIGGGGHAGAAGVKIKTDKLEDFRHRINEYYLSLGLCDQERFFETEADLEVFNLGELNLDLIEELKSLEPFGAGNEVPVFGLRDVFVLDKKMIGSDEQHLRMMVRGKDQRTMKLMSFYAPEEWKQIEQGQNIDILIHLEENEWNGLRNAEGRILDLRVAN
ncbi:single-stranded-DNA-specific exonuclease RecJ [Candidatus Saccharibacteria bacterium]|nr:single-stranded-DNA-specific exonuclease RecJ [Candidatus Saccharibacteria bacterium]